MTSEEKCGVCGINMIAAEMLTKDRPSPLCPNHATEEALTVLGHGDKSQPCTLCRKPSVAIIHDFKFDEKRTGITYPACRTHFKAIFKHNLTKEEYFMLLAQIGQISFNIHDDFYTEDGLAVQPHGRRR
jgi:hypothetical protein